jgi:glycosyltransferase involved in cell wall biosynthesis
MPPVRVLAILPSFIPSVMITIVRPLEQLHRLGRVRARLTLESMASAAEIRNADVVVFCRNVEARYLPLLDSALKFRVPVVYDLDDNFFELPKDPISGESYLTCERKATLLRYLKEASLVRVYSDRLESTLKGLTATVEKIYPPVDLSLIAPARPQAHEHILRIVYATSRTSDDFYQLFMPGLARAACRYPGRVETHFWGPRPAELRSLGAVHHHAPVFQYERFLRSFSSGGFQIGLAPLPDTAFCRCKTNNKFREYGASHIAGVYSNVETYTRCVTDGETGLLVANEPDAWYEALCRLIDDTTLRHRIQTQARKHVEEHYSQDAFVEVFWRQLQRAIQEGQNRLVTQSSAEEEPVRHTHTAAQPAGRQALGRVFPKFTDVVRRLRRTGITNTWLALRWRYNNWWMLAKYRYRFRSSWRKPRA